MLPITSEFDFLTGAASGAVVFAAFVMVRTFRAVVLVVGASVVSYLYFTGGSSELLSHARALQLDLTERMDFAKGLAAGMLFAAKLAHLIRSLFLQ